jgi:uncharacterized protein (DUF1810 family)
VPDGFALARFEQAQDRDDTYQRAVAELRGGRKLTHWMWFVFPQIAGLGASEMSRAYAIESIAEARAYLAHPVLGPRLAECAGIVAAEQAAGAEEMFGPVDAIKLRSSMTLFARAAGTGAVFAEVLERCYGGAEDEETLARL